MPQDTPAPFWTRLLSALLASAVAWTPLLAYAPTASAQDPEGRYERVETEYEVAPEAAELNEQPALAEQPIAPVDPNAPPGAGGPDAPATPGPDDVPIALPGGESANAATPQAISLPNAEGSVEGMGESFSPVLSSGTATFSVPIAVAPGRAGVAPSLALSYATTGGNGSLGFGWSVGAPFISRQTDRGLPHYIDGPAWHPEEDRFLYNGGQELVPVDGAEAGAVDAHSNAGTPLIIAPELAGWQQYRARVEGSFMRFFRSPDSQRWVVQGKDGTRFDFGRLLDGPAGATTASQLALETDPEAPDAVFRWCLTRMSDAHGSTVYYQYDQDDGRSYLRHVYYVSPAACGSSDPDVSRACTEPLESYAAHVRLDYEARGDVFAGYVSGWRMGSARRLRTITVGAYEGSVGSRTRVRRYHLTYAPDSFHSLLESVQVEGRPQTWDAARGVYVGDRTLPEGSDAAGERLPPMRFTYTAMPSGSDPVPGFGAIDGTVHNVVNSPPHSADEGRTDLFDVNSDGLPDVLVTDPARYRTADGEPAVGVFFNGFDGPRAQPAGEAAHFSGAVSMPMRSDLSSVLTLANLNVVPMDIDGDGRSDLLHMPRRRTYGWFAPTRGAAEVASPADQSWRWTYQQVELPLDDTDPRIDLGRDSSFIRVLDVNNDHLIDVVRTTGTAIQTWLNLGYLPGGEGRFGHATFNGAAWDLHTAPIESCLPQGGLPLDFEGPETRLGDMNGDGLQDVVQLRRGRVLYWPGRGDGVFGVGPRHCPRGEGAGRYVEMADPPQQISPELDSVYLSDVNMDGASDLVQVRFREVDVWFNRAGTGWTRRTIATGTPAAPSYAPHLRFADIDGSATTDLIYASAPTWQYLDFAGGQRPRMLERVDNGLGALTSVQYGSSADDYLRDLNESCADCERFAWNTHVPAGADPSAEYRSTGSPVVSTVVRSVSTTDRFDALGREAQVSEQRFAYHDGYYEGIEQEFRGFGAADAIAVGDWNHATSLSRTHFLQGRRPPEMEADRRAHNPNEALKGREVLTEVFDESNTFVSTSFASIVDRHMLTGLDGREIHYAYVGETNELRYDTAPFDPGSGSLELDAVVREAVDGVTGVGPRTAESTRTVAIRGARTSRIRATFDSVDTLGHVLEQTAHGQVELLSGSAIDEAITSHTAPVAIGDGWLWRTARSYLTGSSAPALLLGDTTHTYNAVGDLQSASQFAGRPAVYSYYGEPTAQGSGAGYLLLDQNLVASSVFDAWGNALQSCAGAELGAIPVSTTHPPVGCLRFGFVDYDIDYAQLATTEHLGATRTSSGITTLDHTGSWDRGLGAILSASDPNALVTSVTYDGLGRLTSVTPPDVDGCEGSGRPSTRIAYELTQEPGSQPISRVHTITELSCSATLGSEALESYSYVDGLGRARAGLATGDETHAWVRGGIATLDAKGTARRAYQPDFFDGSATDFASIVAVPGDIPYQSTRYDAFGRARGVTAEDGSSAWTSYHSLSTDVCDPLDLDPSSEHYGTCTTARTDGHGRANDQVLRNINPDTGASEVYRLFSYYRADGAVEAIVRAQSADPRPASYSSGLPAEHVIRTFAYDTVGRRISGVDYDTRRVGVLSHAANWRYLFNRVGDLITVRDPRASGQNFHYDLAGRLVGEQYILREQEGQSAVSEKPAISAIGSFVHDYLPHGVAVDVLYHYDTVPSWASAPAGSSGTLGRATGVTGRAQRSAVAYDDRGNVTWTARQVAVISEALPLTFDATAARPVGVEPSNTDNTLSRPVTYDTAHTYERTATFDHAGRARAMRLPQDPDYTGPAPSFGGLVVYNRRGLPAGVAATANCGFTEPDDTWHASLSAAETACAGDFHPVVTALEYLRDGLVASTTYGDDLGGTRTPTVSTTHYDARRRPRRMTTVRTPDAAASAPELGAVSTVVDQGLVWDSASNLTALVDDRDPMEWPLGHRPQSVDIRHDALYRVIGAEFDYTQASGSRTPSDTGTDWRTEFAQTRSVDPMRQEAAPMLPAAAPGRVASLTYSWDYLANQTSWGDDADQFYERSIGSITNGRDDSSIDRPSALHLATNIGDGSGLHGGSGWVEVDYGVGGNVTAMTVHGQCADNGGATCDDPGGPLATRRAALRADCACAVEQHYEYRWDELNRLSEARRFDRSGGNWSLEVRQRYRYDAANQRIIKQTLDQDGCGTGTGLTPCERTALYVYPGGFERRGLVTDVVGSTYVADATLATETQYVIGGARWVERHGGSGSGFDRERRLTVPIADLIHTTGAVMDVRSGALLEASTYYPNGARETFLNDDSALVAPEVTGFTSKEADEEVGVVYFGERYLIPRIGRWASPDPLHVHAVGGGEVLNSYHYVSGNLLAARDPLGLDIEDAVVGALEYLTEGATTEPGVILGRTISRYLEHGHAADEADQRRDWRASIRHRVLLVPMVGSGIEAIGQSIRDLSDIIITLDTDPRAEERHRAGGRLVVWLFRGALVFAGVAVLTRAGSGRRMAGGDGPPRLSRREARRLRRTQRGIQATIDDARDGRVRRGGDYHGRLPQDLEAEILADPDAVFESTGRSQRWTFRSADGNIVVTEGTGSSRGRIVTSYGPGGPRGASGAAATGGAATDPGVAISAEQIEAGDVPATSSGRTLPAGRRVDLAGDIGHEGSE